MKARTILFYTMSSLLAVMVATVLGLALWALYFTPQEPYLEYLEYLLR